MDMTVPTGFLPLNSEGGATSIKKKTAAVEQRKARVRLERTKERLVTEMTISDGNQEGR